MASHGCIRIVYTRVHLHKRMTGRQIFTHLPDMQTIMFCNDSNDFRQIGWP